MAATGTIVTLPKQKSMDTSKYDLVVGVNYTDKPMPSQSGKSITLATTGGAVQLDGGVSLNLTAYRKAKK